jgi:hypothetical protein
MTLDWKNEAIEQLDFHWRLQARPRLDGLTDDEYFWEPVKGCWSIHPRDDQRTALQAGRGDLVFDFEFPEPEPPPVTTIAWRLNHIATMCFGARAASHFGEPWADNWWNDFEWPATADAALKLLDDSYAAWLTGIRSLDDAAMAKPVGEREGEWRDASYATLILHINREAIHHGAEIALLRDLYRAQL